MKRVLCIILIFAFLLPLAACNREPQNTDAIDQLSVVQMKAICELATLKCYYHVVHKYTEEDASSFLWWDEDKRFWIEYGATVSLGIDASLLQIAVSGDVVTITIPEAKMLRYEVDENTLTADSFIVDKDSADIKAEDEQKAFDRAEAELKETVSNDQAVLDQALEQAKTLLENYVNNFGQTVGKTYTIRWVYLDAEGNVK